MENTYHIVDRKRGRANIRMTWTLCGKIARACFVFAPESTHATCKECLAKQPKRRKRGNRRRPDYHALGMRASSGNYDCPGDPLRNLLA